MTELGDLVFRQQEWTAEITVSRGAGMRREELDRALEEMVIEQAAAAGVTPIGQPRVEWIPCGEGWLYRATYALQVVRPSVEVGEDGQT